MWIRHNRSKPKETPITIPDGFELPEHNWKNGNLKTVMADTNDFCREIIKQAPLIGKHDKVLVDIKVQDLVPGECSCIPGWHCDGPGSPNHPSPPEFFHLIVFGGGETEFLAPYYGGNGSLKLWWDEDADTPQSYHAKVSPHAKAFAIKGGVFNTYGRHDFHRGVFVEKPLTRLLIRITETNTIRAHPNPMKRK